MSQSYAAVYQSMFDEAEPVPANNAGAMLDIVSRLLWSDGVVVPEERYTYHGSTRPQTSVRVEGNGVRCPSVAHAYYFSCEELIASFSAYDHEMYQLRLVLTYTEGHVPAVHMTLCYRGQRVAFSDTKLIRRLGVSVDTIDRLMAVQLQLVALAHLAALGKLQPQP